MFFVGSGVGGRILLLRIFVTLSELQSLVPNVSVYSRFDTLEQCHEESINIKKSNLLPFCAEVRMSMCLKCTAYKGRSAAGESVSLAAYYGAHWCKHFNKTIYDCL